VSEWLLSIVDMILTAE